MSRAPAHIEAHNWGDAPELYGPRHDYRESLIMRRVRRLAVPGGQALDAGAGAGSLALKLAGAGFRVTAVDGSEAFAARLGERLAAAPGGPHRALRGDMSALPVPDAAFDLVTCAEVLEHLEDDAAAARELHRAARPGGLLLVTVPAGPHRMDWTDRWAGHHRRYDVAGLERLLGDAGFVDLDVRGWGFPFTGLYHRHVYRPMLGRRLARGAEGLGGGAQGGATGLAARVLRGLLELDTPFTGHVPGWFGLIATARRP